jgi:peptidoglycan hydrolase-like protein with peptidoglycan-binding domain
VIRLPTAAGWAAALAIAVLGSASPASAATKLRTGGTHAIGTGTGEIVFVGDKLTVTGRAPAQPGASLSFVRGGKAVKRVALPAGAPFTAGFTPRGAGPVTVRATGATPFTVQAIKPAADSFQHGLNVRFLQERLRALRYGGVPLSGFYDPATARAVIAYRKVNNMQRTTNASSVIFHELAIGRGAYVPRTSSLGAHIEGDLTHQVIALVNPGGQLDSVYITSSGRPALKTPVGVHRVYKQERGVNYEGEYNMSFFKGICGVHGYFVVPTFPHSHCCLRVPIADSARIRDFITLGMAVDIFYRRSATA